MVERDRLPINYIQPVMDESVRQLCQRPYYNHSKGCPNYGKRDTCPPKAVLLTEYFDMAKPIIAVWVAFDLAQHRAKMKERHPNWSRRQLDCCLYWQGGVNKRLRQEVRYNKGRSTLFNRHKELIATYVPEAMGVNVTETMRKVGLILEWPPENIVRKIAFVGCPNAQGE